MYRIYEPVEEHRRRAAFITMMDRNHGADVQNCPESLTLWGTPGESFVEQGDMRQEGAAVALRTPPCTDSETLVVTGRVTEVPYKVKMSKNTEVSDDSCPSSPTRTRQASPSRIDASPFSQYSINPDSPEPFDRGSAQTSTGSKARKLPFLTLRPSRKSRPFRRSAHSQGKTVWMTTVSYEDLSNPPEPSPEDEPGLLYIHRNLTDDTLQVWLLENVRQWVTVQLGDKTQHPTFGDRYLAIRLDGTPNWITLASWHTAKKWVNSQ